jgi:hypothetical protein
MAHDAVMFDLPPIGDRCGNLVPDGLHKDDDCIKHIPQRYEQRLCCNFEYHIAISLWLICLSSKTAGTE